MQDEFSLDQRLEKSTCFLTDLKLSRVLLHNDSRFPWLVLVPRVSNQIEIFDLKEDDQSLLLREISLIGAVLKSYTKAHKINIANLGNMVPQLHIHIIARFEEDPAWPGPVWGVGEAKQYQEEQKNTFIMDMLRLLKE